jgi:hypothetical protein
MKNFTQAALIALFLFATGVPAAQAGPLAGAPAYYPSGPQNDVPVSALEGWTVCFQEEMSEGKSVIDEVLKACDGTHLLMAGRTTGSATILTLAAAPTGDVTTDTGESNTPHNANGTGWYFSQSFSWGFARIGDAIFRSSCDTGIDTHARQRICWHTGGGFINDGWRVGDAESVYAGYERLLYKPSTTATATPGAAGVTFNTQAQTTVSAPKTVTISNTGSDRLVVRTTEIGGTNPDDFFVANNGCLQPVSGGESCTLSVRFAPQGPNGRSGTLTVESNAGTTTVNLGGTGGALPQGPPGQNGANGQNGAAGAPGAAGEKGPAGTPGGQGTQGAQGVQGEPGKAVVTCKVGKAKKGKVKVTCTVKNAAVAARAKASLRRGGKVVARARATSKGRVSFRPVRKGRYTLRVGTASFAVSIR